MKLKSVFSRLPKWLILLVILAAFYFIFRKSVEGFIDATVPNQQSANTCVCYYGYKKSKTGCSLQPPIKQSSTAPPPNKAGYYGTSLCAGTQTFRNHQSCAC